MKHSIKGHCINDVLPLITIAFPFSAIKYINRLQNRFMTLSFDCNEIYSSAICTGNFIFGDLFQECDINRLKEKCEGK